MKRTSSTRITIIILLVIVTVVGYYAYLSNKTRDSQREASMTFVQEVLSRDLQLDYPPTPKEVVKYYFTLPDQSELDPKLKWRYQKGLGGWGGENKALLQQIMDKEGGLEGLLLTLTQDDCASESLEHWMGDSADYRKQSLRGREFHIGMM